MSNHKRIAALLLSVIAVVMIYLGITAGILPPTLTGVGFLLIALTLIPS